MWRMSTCVCGPLVAPQTVSRPPVANALMLVSQVAAPTWSRTTSTPRREQPGNLNPRAAHAAARAPDQHVFPEAQARVADQHVPGREEDERHRGRLFKGKIRRVAQPGLLRHGGGTGGG